MKILISLRYSHSDPDQMIGQNLGVYAEDTTSGNWLPSCSPVSLHWCLYGYFQSTAVFTKGFFYLWRSSEMNQWNYLRRSERSCPSKLVDKMQTVLFISSWTYFGKRLRWPDSQSRTLGPSLEPYKAKHHCCYLSYLPFTSYFEDDLSNHVPGLGKVCY